MAELEQLYREHYGEYVRVASAVVGDEARGVESVQDAFASAISSRRKFRRDGSPEGWLWRIVINAARASRHRTEAIPIDEVTNRFDGMPIADELGVRRWIAGLPERQRLAVFLRHFADLDYRSISIALDIEVGTVSATLASAYANLREVIPEVRGHD
jgi:RNA polymerase sigma-70 factor (ECF subfamily)